MPRVLLLVLAFLLLPASARADGERPVRIILDTDIGSDNSDNLALALALTHPDVELRGVTTVGSAADDRAWIACRFLTHARRRVVPVAMGAQPKVTRAIGEQIQYRRHPAVIFNRTAKPAKQDAVEFLYAELKAHPGEITLVATGPLTNIANLLEKHDDAAKLIKRIVVAAGSRPGGKAGEQWNFLTSGIPVVLVSTNRAEQFVLDAKERDRLFRACTPLTLQLQNLYQLSEDTNLDAGEAFAVAFAAKPMVAREERGDAFRTWLVDTLTAGDAALPKPPPNRSAAIKADGFPNRVHAFEDYETDAEKRWWMSGRAETKNVPPDSKRACRGVLTQDFDDLMGDMRTSYTAVVFNPVPGPPMGKNPRLRFRYFLKGTDTLRVQIYSLTRGFHRCLSLTGLPQGSWESATVDMTAVRRPDGSGGPLAENERIDDIQFYVDPRAELLIDDVVLYDAPAPGERRPFPKRILYTGLFDTGKQGQEWPGTFDIVEKKGYFWRAARSVPGKSAGADGAVLRLGMRGRARAGAKTALFTRYQLMGGDALRLDVEQRAHMFAVRLKDLEQDRWAELRQDLAAEADAEIEALEFRLGPGAELLVDDVLLYEPGP